jgi:hypothetical protein
MKEYKFNENGVSPGTAAFKYKSKKVDLLIRVAQWKNKWGAEVTEAIYMNYPEPVKLHDYKLLGTDCWDRQRIKRKIERFIKKLKALPVQERNAIVHKIKTEFQ